LELVREKRPDILLLDISMPQMDGIELIQRLKEENLDCKIIFLSAYSNFTYAQSAVKYGAFDFILKPIDEYELMDTVKRCVALIRRESADSPAGSGKTGQMVANAALVRLLTGAEPLSEDDRLILRRIGIAPEGDGIAIGALLIDADSDAAPVKQTAPAEAESDVLSGVTENLALIGDDERLLLWTTESGDGEVLTSAFQTALSHRNRTPSDTFISTVRGIADIRKIHPECSFARLYPQLHSQSGAEAPGRRGADGKAALDEKYTAVAAERLTDAIRQKNPAEIKTLMDQIFRHFAQREKIYDLGYMKLKCIEYIDNLRDILYISEDPTRNAENDILITSKKTINIQGSVYYLYNAMFSALMNFCAFIESAEDFKGTHLVTQVIASIKENYSNITLASTAEKLYVSPTYLSRTFAAERGETFSRYLQKYRMKMAKEFLLDPQYKIYTVAKMVGYSDVAHFSKAFKQIEGVSPMKFKNLSGGIEKDD
jgi:YesN/AraC family two-component response regulator